MGILQRVPVDNAERLIASGCRRLQVLQSLSGTQGHQSARATPKIVCKASDSASIEYASNKKEFKNRTKRYAIILEFPRPPSNTNFVQKPIYNNPPSNGGLHNHSIAAAQAQHAPSKQNIDPPTWGYDLAFDEKANAEYDSDSKQNTNSTWGYGPAFDEKANAEYDSDSKQNINSTWGYGPAFDEKANAGY